MSSSKGRGDSSGPADDNTPSIEDVQPDPGVIVRCTVPNTMAITFDDGPSDFTAGLLDQLKGYGIKATFFINGANSVDATLPQYQAVIKRAHDEGHQVASHTMHHADLTAQPSDDGVRAEMTANDAVIVSAIGRRPRYMRPPYGNANAHTMQLLQGMGYRVVNWSADTKDYVTDDAAKSATVYQQMLARGVGELIVLEHDIMRSTTTQLLDRVVRGIQAKGWRMVTVAECVGDANGAYQ